MSEAENEEKSTFDYPSIDPARQWAPGAAPVKPEPDVPPPPPSKLTNEEVWEKEFHEGRLKELGVLSDTTRDPKYKRELDESREALRLLAEKEQRTPEEEAAILDTMYPSLGKDAKPNEVVVYNRISGKAILSKTFPSMRSDIGSLLSVSVTNDLQWLDLSKKTIHNPLRLGREEGRGVNLSDATFEGTVIPPESSFKGARMVNVDLRGAKMEWVNLDDCDLTGVKWDKNSSFQGSSMRRATIPRSLIDSGLLRGVILDGVTVVEDEKK